MPDYTIKTRDGLTVTGIPDKVDPDSPELRNLVERMRRNKEQSASYSSSFFKEPSPETTQINPQHAATEGQKILTTPEGLMGAAVRGGGPYAMGAAGGALVGLAGGPFAEVTVPAGAALGTGYVGFSKLVGDPLTETLNNLLDMHMQTPSESFEALFDKMGIAKPKTPTERVVRAATEGAAGGFGQVGLGRALQAPGMGRRATDIGRVLSSEPMAQVTSGFGGGAASQTAQESGLGVPAQFGAGLAGSLLGGNLAPKEIATPVPGAFDAPSLQAERTALTTPVTSQATEQAMEEVGTLVKKASRKGFRGAAAKTKLAELASVNPEAKAAAQALGMDLPPDVLSDNPQIRAAAGLTRSVAGSEPEAAWRNTVRTSVDKADELMKSVDAAFIEGAPAPGVTSEKVRDSLIKARGDMSRQAQEVYQQVDSSVQKGAKVELGKLKETLDIIVGEVGEGGLSAQERKLRQMLESKEGVTYARLIREKNLIGQAIAGKDSPYGNMETASLKRLYGALAEDQLANVGTLGGDDLRSQLHAANLLYAKERALGQRIVTAFGKEFEGSIANKMRTAITSGAKGGTDDFLKLMKLVPDDLKKETVATSLASVFRAGSGSEKGGFGFAEFAKMYPGLRANPTVYKQIVSSLGEGSDEMLRNLYSVSKRITEARANVLTTGKANQALVGAMQAESFMARMLNSAVTKRASTVAGAATGGLGGAVLGDAVSNVLSVGNKDVLGAAGKMFNSEEFRTLAYEAATKPKVSAESVRKFTRADVFRKFAKLANIPKKEDDQFRWIMSAMRGQEATQPEEQE